MGTLKVTATGSNGFNQEIWNESGDHANEWFKAIIDVPSVEELNVSFPFNCLKTKPFSLNICRIM